MTGQAVNTNPEPSRWGWLYKISAAAAVIAGTLLLIGLAGLIASTLQTGAKNGWPLLENNWLVLIFKLHAEFSDVQAEMLHRLNLLDMVFLVILGLIGLSLSTVFSKARRVWLWVASALSLVGILLFIATQTAGRSTVMLVVFILSLVMLGNELFSKAIIYSGILASILLLVGDVTVGIHSSVITVLFGVGYVLLISWFFLVAQVFFRLGSGGLNAKVQ